MQPTDQLERTEKINRQPRKTAFHTHSPKRQSQPTHCKPPRTWRFPCSHRCPFSASILHVCQRITSVWPSDGVCRYWDATGLRTTTHCNSCKSLGIHPFQKPSVPKLRPPPAPLATPRGFADAWSTMCTSPGMLPIGVIQGRDSDLQLSPSPTPLLLCAEYRAGAEHACASIHSADGGSVPEMQRVAPKR